MSKVGLGFLLIAALLLTPLWAAAAEFKVGVVDGMDVVSKSSAGKGVQAAIKRKSEELSKPFGQRRQDLAKEVENFQKQASLMKEDARKTKAAELEKKMQDFQKQGADAEKQLQQFQESQLAPLFQKLEGAVKSRGPAGEAGYGPRQAQCRAPLYGPQTGYHRQGAQQVRRLMAS